MENFEKYFEEMRKMKRRASVPASGKMTEENPPEREEGEGTSSGKLQVAVTTLSGLYPVKNARVTVFSGTPDKREVLYSVNTDRSGKTPVFSLPAPERAESQLPGEETPYSSYSVSVNADGFRDRLLLNLPVFSGVTSIQKVDLVSLASSGGNQTPAVTDEKADYHL